MQVHAVSRVEQVGHGVLCTRRMCVCVGLRVGVGGVGMTARTKGRRENDESRYIVCDVGRMSMSCTCNRTIPIQTEMLTQAQAQRDLHARWRSQDKDHGLRNVDRLERLCHRKRGCAAQV